jgi:hypothetical protein
MSEPDTASTDFDTQLAAVERFIADVQQGSVPTGEAMRAYRDVHRPAIERLRAQLAEFEALLAEAGGALDQVGGADGVPTGTA